MSYAGTPETWECVDCGFNTFPGGATAATCKAIVAGLMEGFTIRLDDQCEVYMVRTTIWEAAGMDGLGGCLCIGCLEERLGRRLKPRDFMRRHSLNVIPGTERLLSRREGRMEQPKNEAAYHAVERQLWAP
jgi:hypothetical protein